MFITERSSCGVDETMGDSRNFGSDSAMVSFYVHLIFTRKPIYPKIAMHHIFYMDAARHETCNRAQFREDDTHTHTREEKKRRREEHWHNVSSQCNEKEEKQSTATTYATAVNVLHIGRLWFVCPEDCACVCASYRAVES